MGSVIVTPFFQSQKIWKEGVGQKLLTLSVAKGANLRVGRSVGPNRRGKIGAEIARADGGESHGPTEAESSGAWLICCCCWFLLGARYRINEGSMQHHKCCTGGSGNSTKDNVLVVVPGGGNYAHPPARTPLPSAN